MTDGGTATPRGVFGFFALVMGRFSDYHLLTIRRRKQPDANFTWARLIGAALDSAAWMREVGIGPGVTVGIMRHHSPELVIDFLGAMFAGALPCVVAPPNPRMSAEVFRAKLDGMSRGSGIGVFIVDPSTQDALTVCESEANVRVVVGQTLESITPRTNEQLREHLWAMDAATESDAPLFLQHSSGTSGVPKGVVITHHMIMLQVALYGRELDAGRPLVIVSWLPLYHDMGMVACLWGCLIWNVETVLISNFDWVLDPLSLIDTVLDCGGQLVWLPNFAFALLAATQPDREYPADSLEYVRWTSCSEPTTPMAIDAFFGRFANAGADPRRFYVCYAMAENVFAVSVTGDGPPRRLRLDRRALEHEGRAAVVGDDASAAAAREVFSCGSVMPGTEVRIVPLGGSPSGEETQQGVVGQIHLRGEHLFTSYHGRPDLTEAAIVDGWYATGDLGFMHEGELYVVGRCRDLIICGGRNIDPLELEEMASSTPGVVPGRVCCVGVVNESLGTEEVHLLVEVLHDESGGDGSASGPKDAFVGDRQEVVRALKQRAATLNLPLRQVWCLTRGWLVKSSSGKISRGMCREKLVKELLGAGTA